MRETKKTPRRARKPTSQIPARKSPPRPFIERKSATYRFLNKIDLFLETHPACRLLGIVFACVTFGSLIVTMIGVQRQLEDSKILREELAEEREFRKEQRIAEAWNSIHRREGGDTRKGQHITYLINQGRLGDGLDLSCSSIGTMQDGNCTSAPQISGVDFRGVETRPIIRRHEVRIINETTGLMEIADFRRTVSINAKGTQLQQWVVDDAKLQFAFDDGTKITQLRAKGATLIFNNNQGIIEYSDFGEATLIFTGRGPSIRGANISAATLISPSIEAFNECLKSERLLPDNQTFCKEPDVPDMQNAWFWADAPPRGYRGIAEHIAENSSVEICDPEKSKTDNMLEKVGIKAIDLQSSKIQQYAIDVEKSFQRSYRAIRNSPRHRPTGGCLNISLNEAKRRFPSPWKTPRKIEDFAKKPSKLTIEPLRLSIINKRNFGADRELGKRD